MVESRLGSGHVEFDWEGSQRLIIESKVCHYLLCLDLFLNALLRRRRQLSLGHYLSLIELDVCVDLLGFRSLDPLIDKLNQVSLILYQYGRHVRAA